MLIGAPIAAFILLPLAMKRDISSLAYMGFFSVCSLLYVTVLLIIEQPFYWSEYRHQPGFEVRAFIIDANILTSFSLVAFSYTCQISTLPIYSELVRPKYRRIKKVINRALLFDFVLYTVVASAGYFSLFNGTNDIVVERLPLPGYDPDYTMLFAAFLICIALISAFATNFVPTKNLLFNAFQGNSNYSQKA